MACFISEKGDLLWTFYGTVRLRVSAQHTPTSFMSLSLPKKKKMWWKSIKMKKGEGSLWIHTPATSGHNLPRPAAHAS